MTLRVIVLDTAHAFPGDDTVPGQALTMGVATILDTRETLLAATGVAKAPAIACAVEGPITPDCPASAFQLHPTAMIVRDRAAAGDLRRRTL